MAAAVVLLGVTLVQLRLWWKHQHARTTLLYFKKNKLHHYYFIIFPGIYLLLIKTAFFALRTILNIDTCTPHDQDRTSSRS